MRLNLDILKHSGIEIDELVATGGGARNRDVVQLKADVLGKPIGIAAVNEAGCMGVRDACQGSPLRRGYQRPGAKVGARCRCVQTQPQKRRVVSRQL